MNSRWSADSSTNETTAERPCGRRRERRQPRIVEPHRDLGGEVLELVAGQPELGEDDEVGTARRAPPSSSSWWRARLSSSCPEPRRDLGEGDRDASARPEHSARRRADALRDGPRSVNESAS